MTDLERANLRLTIWHEFKGWGRVDTTATEAADKFKPLTIEEQLAYAETVFTWVTKP